MKPKLKIFVGRATHFLRWELPYFRKYFELINKPQENAVLFAFGPDILMEAATLPACLKVALLFPGFGLNPYHNLAHRRMMSEVIEAQYDLVFVNPGPMYEAFKHTNKVSLCPFSLDTRIVQFRSPRRAINSLLHCSNDSPQKDRQRSAEIMELTGLEYEVFPPLRPACNQHLPVEEVDALRHRTLTRLRLTGYNIKRSIPRLLRNLRKRYWPSLNRCSMMLNLPPVIMPPGYVRHKTIIKKYQEYDGFVHIAAETPPYVDGKYTATLLEAGLTGAILFWHDTLGLGNDFETIFDLSLEPEKAAGTILQIKKNIDVEKHSRLTREEILARCSPEYAMRSRYEKMRAML